MDASQFGVLRAVYELWKGEERRTTYVGEGEVMEGYVEKKTKYGVHLVRVDELESLEKEEIMKSKRETAAFLHHSKVADVAYILFTVFLIIENWWVRYNHPENVVVGMSWYMLLLTPVFVIVLANHKQKRLLLDFAKELIEKSKGG